jgi:purine-binding chemotaxis protein CheW
MGELGENQYLTFVLDEELYAVPVGKVREVLEYIKPSKLPRTADYMKGIINVRDTGIPVVDLRTKFGMNEIPVTRESAILVLEIRDTDGRQNVIGALADEVHEVIEIKDEDLESAPRFGTKIDTGFIHSVGKRDGQFVIVLDIDRAFNDEETEVLTEAVTTAPA